MKDMSWAERSDDSDNIKVVEEEIIKPNGKTVKIRKQVRLVKKITKVDVLVAERRNWPKFGIAAGAPPGPEPGVTERKEIVPFEWHSASKKDAKTDTQQLAPTASCRNCGGKGHFTHKCPYKDAMPDLAELVPEDKSVLDAASAASTGKYVPPSMRAGASGSGNSYRSRDDEGTIRVTNLAESVTENIMHDLFAPFGPIARLFVGIDKQTNLCKGFAFVKFIYIEDAKRAMVELKDYGLQHLIINLEWAKSKKRN